MKRLKKRDHVGHVLVCHGGRCSKHGADDVRRALRAELSDAAQRVRVGRTLCQGDCKDACVVTFEGKDMRRWGNVQVKDVAKLSKKILKRCRV